jgi:hypothetical protein
MLNFHFDLSLKLSQGAQVHDFSGEVQNDHSLGGVHLPTSPLKI